MQISLLILLSLITRQLAFAHWAYLSAILFQAKAGVGSRGSAAVLDDADRIIPENPAFREQVLETRFNGRNFEHGFVPCRPIPREDGWFETVWAEFRNKEVYQK